MIDAGGGQRQGGGRQDSVFPPKTPTPDRQSFLRNRRQLPAEELPKHAGRHVAWSPGGTRTIAGDEDLLRLDAKVFAAGYNPADARCPSLFELTRPLGDLEDLLLADCAGKTLGPNALFISHGVGKPYRAKKLSGGVRKAEAGCDLDGKTYDAMPCRQPGRVVPRQRVRLALIDDVRNWDKGLQPAERDCAPSVSGF